MSIRWVCSYLKGNPRQYAPMMARITTSSNSKIWANHSAKKDWKSVFFPACSGKLWNFKLNCFATISWYTILFFNSVMLCLNYFILLLQGKTNLYCCLCCFLSLPQFSIMISWVGFRISPQKSLFSIPKRSYLVVSSPIFWIVICASAILFSKPQAILNCPLLYKAAFDIKPVFEILTGHQYCFISNLIAYFSAGNWEWGVRVQV